MSLVLRSRWRVVLAVVALVASFVIAPSSGAAQAPTAVAATPVEADFVASVNQERAARGLDPLTVDGVMTAAARDWAEEMAHHEHLHHAPDITTGAPSGWLKVGENIGRGRSVDSLMDAFMASPAHAANLLDPAFTRVGVGVASDDDGRLYTTHRFAATRTDVAPTCKGRVATIVAQPGVETVGTSGADVIVGTSGPDVIDGRGGDDVICGRGGDDRIEGGRGSDLLHGGGGDDTLRGQSGSDALTGGSGRDRLYGGSGRDHLAGQRGADHAFGGSGRDTCDASKRDEVRSCILG